MTKEQVYRQQMQALGIYEEIFEPEIRTLCRIEREYTRAQKAWSATAPPGGKPSFLDDHFAVIQKLRAEILQHREALGLTPKALRKLTGMNLNDTPEQKDLITAKLDQIAERVAGYDGGPAWRAGGWAPVEGPIEDPFAGIPAAEEAARISQEIDTNPASTPQEMDEELRQAVHEDMG